MVQFRFATLMTARGIVLGGALAASLILAGCGGKSSSSSTATVSTITVTPSTASVPISGKVTFTAAGTDSSGNAVSGVIFTWASATSSVATIDANGVATGITAGTSSITAASSGVTSTAATLTVTPTVASISVAPTTASIHVGATQTFTATAKDASGNAITGVTFNWANSNGLLATINSSGIVTGLAPGTVLITATSGGVTSPAAALTIIP